MADSPQVKELTDKLQQGVKDLFTSDRYAEYLKTMSRFHTYSTRNTLLIYLQMPTASRVAGYQDWRNKFKRQVKKGEHGIKILAPTPFVTKKEMEKIDPETQRPIIGEDGEPLREEVEIKIARFKVVSVFDISQTDGEPLPSLVQNLTGDVEQYSVFMDALRKVSPLPIEFEPLPENMDGVCRFGKNIAIREGMSEVQTVCAVIHEITHAKLHDIEAQRLLDENAKPKDRRTEEIEAESVSYAVCNYFGIETDVNSFGYILEWSKTRELKELNASLDTIRKTATELISGIEDIFREIAKERDIVFEVGEQQIKLDELSTAQSTDTVPIGDSDVPSIITEYARNAEVNNSYKIGSTVLMMPVFDDGNFNRTGKKIRVTVEEPIGKYLLFSHDEGEDKRLYFLTTSGRIDRLAGYFNSVWDEEQHKRVDYRPTETELDKVLIQVVERFEHDMANPTMWAMYQHAAVLNRLDECEAHNMPVRKLREEESQRRHEEAERARQEEQSQKQEKFDGRIDEIAKAIETGKTISVGYNEYEFDGKNPVLELFKLYGVNLPLRTQGWVNTGLAEISDGSYRYYKSKHKGNSTAFGSYLRKLREAIITMPIEQKRERMNPSNPESAIKEDKKTVEHKLYEKLAEMFPQIESGEYSYLRLESKGFEPLSFEWIGENQLSMMYTYTMNGDLMYDPMIVFEVDRETQTMTATNFEQSMPPLYRRVTENGNGLSIDGNGNEHTVRGLQEQINSFAVQWFDNIDTQHYQPVRATAEIDGEDMGITFNENGKPIIPTLETSEKQYDLGYGFLGNGITVWNRAEERNGDYVTVAHIGTDRNVTFYDKEMPFAVKQQIDTVAKSSDTRAFGFVPAPESIPPNFDNTPTPTSVYEAVKQVLPETAISKTPKPNLPLPDPMTTITDRNEFGYTYDDMLPMSKLRALELFDTEHCVYMLYSDNTESMAFEREEIINHIGLCGIEREDWERSPLYAAQMAVAVNNERNHESDLLYGEGNRFGIYQIRNDIAESHNFRFAPMKELEALGLSVDRTNYELVYTAPFSEKIEFLSDRYPVLNKIYQDFNINHPADYAARSVSVSDVIVLKYNDDVSSHFVDRVGFVELNAFLGNEVQHTQATPISTPEKETKTPTTYSQLGNRSEKPAEQKKESDRNTATKTKPTLMERLEEGKRKATLGGQKLASTREADKEVRE